MPRSRMWNDVKAASDTAASLLTRLVSRPAAPHTVTLFRSALYLWLLAQTVLTLPAAASFWGPDGYVFSQAVTGWRVDAARTLLLRPEVAPFWPAFVVGQLAALAVGLTGRHLRFMAAAVWFFTLNLDSRCLAVLNGGHNLVEILLVYNLLLDPTPAADRPSLRVTASNVGLALCRIQVAVMYAVSGLSKLQGTLWPHGVALYYVLATPEFSHPWAAPLAKSEAFVVAASYGTVGFMLSFPALVWVRGAKPYVLGVGFLLHAGIATMMGLVDFATAVMVGYVAFFPDAWSRRVLDLIRGGPLLVQSPGRSWERVIRALDWRGVMHISDTAPGGGWADGLTAATMISSRLPLLTPLVPLLWLTDYTGLGTAATFGVRWPTCGPLTTGQQDNPGAVGNTAVV